MKKVFVLFLVSVSCAVFALIVFSDLAHARKGEIPQCVADLESCEGDLGVCEDDLAACEAGCSDPDPCAQIFPGDGAGNGPALTYTDNGDGTATDNNTRLTWEIKLAQDDIGGNCADVDQALRSVHCANNTYTWSTGSGAPDGTLFTVFLDILNNKCDGDETTICTSDTDCVGIGNELCGHAGYRDWYIPNIRELQSIVDYGMLNPATSIPGATNNSAPIYWSSTPRTLASGNAWGVFFGGGNVTTGTKTDDRFARAARPCP